MGAHPGKSDVVVINYVGKLKDGKIFDQAQNAPIPLGQGMIKGFVFGILIVLISCHQGLVASNGAVGVGLGTTRAVVFSSLALLIANFFLTMLLNYFFPLGTAL